MIQLMLVESMNRLINGNQVNGFRNHMGCRNSVFALLRL